MATIGNQQYSNPKNINLKGGILRFDTTKATNPMTGDTLGTGLYVDGSNQLTFWDKAVAFVIGGPKLITAATETIAAGGTTTALSLSKTVHYIDADAGGDAFTLAAGTTGQIMTILMKSSTGVATITPAGLAGSTNILLNTVGEAVILQAMDSKWFIIGGNGYTTS